MSASPCGAGSAARPVASISEGTEAELGQRHALSPNFSPREKLDPHHAYTTLLIQTHFPLVNRLLLRFSKNEDFGDILVRKTEGPWCPPPPTHGSSAYGRHPAMSSHTACVIVDISRLQSSEFHSLIDVRS